MDLLRQQKAGAECQLWHSASSLCSVCPPAQCWEIREIPLNVPSASNTLGQGSIAPKADPAPSQEAAPQCPHPNSILLLLLSGCLEICGQSVLLHLLLIWQDVKYSAA